MRFWNWNRRFELTANFDLELGLRLNVGYSNQAGDTRPYDY
jgi:hypothetical protein